jgi:2-polyprenyl-6-methoxyphenol hydroxylase-like FAD-dependent oxidoreductase
VAFSGTVIVVGASICGLSCALALAQQSRRVRILEARLDPRSERGRRALALGAEQTELANAALERGDDDAAVQHFGSANRSCAAVWGSRQRNLLFDSHSLSYLHSLGVTVDALPSLRALDTHLGAGQPSIRIRYDPRERASGGWRLDAATIIAQRDPVAVSTIANVEGALRDAAEANPQIELRYDAQVVGYEETPTGLTVSHGDAAAAMTTDLLVVADGAGSRSLSRRLGIDRIEAGAESVDIAAFQCDPSSQVLGHSLNEGWLDARATPKGWVVFLCSGAGLLTVNVRRVVEGDSPTALELARAAGVEGSLAEQPADVRYVLDRAARFTAGPRTVIVGDAACRASPVWAFGAQFALLWAQMVADLCASPAATFLKFAPVALAAFSADAQRVANMRLEFERSALRLVDFANPEIRSASSESTAASMMAAIDDLELSFDSIGPHGGSLKLRLGMKLDDLVGASRSADLAAFCRSVGRVHFEGLFDLHFDGGRGESKPTKSGSTHYRTDLETIRLSDGSVSMKRSNAGYWTIAMNRAVLNRRVLSPGRDSVAIIETAELLLPDEFVTQTLQDIGPQLWMLGLTRTQPLSFEVELQPGAFEMGTFKVALRGPTLVRANLLRERGTARISFRLARGMATVENFSEFVRRTPLAATRTLRMWQTMFGRFADPVVDLWGAAASQFVRQVDFDIKPDGTGSATYHASGIPIRFPLSADDVRLLIGKLFDSASCARIMNQYQQRLVAARVAPAAAGSSKI